MSTTPAAKPKASVDDMAAELRSLNEKADRFEQYLAHVSTARAHERLIGRWAVGLGVAWFPIAFGIAMLNQLAKEQGAAAIDVQASTFAFAMLGIFWGLSKMRP